jgi:protein-tyrosine phosphatase
VTAGVTVVGVSRLDDHVLLADAGLASAGVTVGVYCQAGISRTSTVAIACLMLGGESLNEAARAVRQARPQAMPAPELWHSLERIALLLA